MGPLFVEAFRYHRWANLFLLDVCGRLTEEQLELTSPGTYGTVFATIVHLVGAEQRYIHRLGGSEPRVTSRWEFGGVAPLRAEAELSADELIGLASRAQPEDELETQVQDRRYRLKSAIVLLQALHHGNDHRTHICTVLGAHGIEYGDMDVWAYADATGASVPLGVA
ncbi:MAG TPA: DinB family protein [Candidatus Udaeobacter sp.]|nr:DinB family protein [Candidatus Udaeobacter sp.]